jgi:hypothetical protein
MTTRTNPLIHARMYALADFYGVFTLKELAIKKFRGVVQAHWNSKEFAQAVQVVYTTTVAKDSGLRQVVKDVLMNHNELLKKPEIQAVLREVSGLAFEILMEKQKTSNTHYERMYWAHRPHRYLEVVEYLARMANDDFMKWH